MKTIPYVIDNQRHKMAEVLRDLLADHAGRSFDVATAYFNVGGFMLLKNELAQLGSFRLLLGDEPENGVDLGLRRQKQKYANLLKEELENQPFSENTVRAVEELIAFLRREDVQVRRYDKGFLHAKSYIFYGDLPGSGSRLSPIAAIVGSSNFTRPGLTTNKELNLTHKAILSDEEVEAATTSGQLALWSTSTPDAGEVTQRRRWMSSVGAAAIAELDGWFERQWGDSSDYKEALVDLLVRSQFISEDYSPYQIYLKALYEYFRDELEERADPNTRSAVNLAEFQEDAVKKARRILARYDGVLIADSVGLGKTWIGKKLLEDYAYHQRQKALVVCPAALRQMWHDELNGATIAASIVSQEEVGRDEFDTAAYDDIDVILVDESHNFRNSATGRYQNLERIISANGRRGRNGDRKKLILLSATPINNGIFDLYNQLNLFTGNDQSYFAAAGIGDLKKYFFAAQRQTSFGGETVALFNLLEEVVIRRTRPFIRKYYPEAEIEGKKISWPERTLMTIPYNLEAAYPDIYKDIVEGINKLTLAPYYLENYKKREDERDQFELGREQALVGIFKSRYLKRFESSVKAFRISVRRALEFTATFLDYLLDDKLVSSADFRKLSSYLEAEGGDDDATPQSRADAIDADAEAKEYLQTLPTLDTKQYDLRAINKALRQDTAILEDIWAKIKDISPSADAKLKQLKERLAGELKGQKVIIFSYYRDTARYLYDQFAGDNPDATQWREAAGRPTIRRMDSGTNVKDRARIVQAFAPERNNKPEIAGTDEEIDILIATDVLSEGQNLQDCGLLINYDLHWNPTRMVQRAGRIDRLGSKFPLLTIANMFPDQGLEKLLGLISSLNSKISQIDSTGFLDASILGEVVHPQNFNTLKRIQEEDDSVLEEQEQFAELATSEFMLRTLRDALLLAGARETLEDLPDGIHSGLVKPSFHGMFFYFTAPTPQGEGRQHFWRYYDAQSGSISDNRYLIAEMIRCSPDTPRTTDDQDPFVVQEKIIADILKSVEKQTAIEEAPKTVDAVQKNIITILRSAMNNPGVARSQVAAAITALDRPLAGVYIKELKEAYKEYSQSQNLGQLLEAVCNVAAPQAAVAEVGATRSKLKREDLHLVCFDYIC